MKRWRCWLAGHAIDIELSPELAHLADAFACAPSDDGEPAGLRFTVRVDQDHVDSALKVVSSAAWHQRQGEAHLWLATEPRHVQSLVPGSTTGHAPALGTLILDRAEGIDGSLRARPGVEVISAWAASLGILPAHASGIAIDGRAIILIGDSGSGKTTTALALAERGWDLVSDDRCFILRDGAKVKVASLYPTTVVTTNSLARLAARDWHDLGRTHHGKHARRLPSGMMVAGLTELAGVVWVSPSARLLYTPEQMNRRDALVPWQSALAPALQAHGPSRNWVRSLADLSGAVPTWRMGLDWNFDRIDAALRDLVGTSVPAQ